MMQVMGFECSSLYSSRNRRVMQMRKSSEFSEVDHPLGVFHPVLQE